MKINMKAIVIAMVLYGMFAGFAAAETPDAGDTWGTAKSFAVQNNAYTFVDGTFTLDPADGEDRWYSNDPNVGDTLWLYLDSTSYNDKVTAELYDGSLNLMQRLYKDGNVNNDHTLDAKPTYVKVAKFPKDLAYEFALSRNV